MRAPAPDNIQTLCVCRGTWWRCSGSPRTDGGKLGPCMLLPGEPRLGCLDVSRTSDVLSTMPLCSAWSSMQRMAVRLGWPVTGAPASADVRPDGPALNCTGVSSQGRGLGAGTFTSFSVPWEDADVKPIWFAVGRSGER